MFDNIESRTSTRVSIEQFSHIVKDNKQFTFQGSGETDSQNVPVGESMSLSAEMVRGNVEFKLNGKEFNNDVITETYTWIGMDLPPERPIEDEDREELEV